MTRVMKKRDGGIAERHTNLYPGPEHRAFCRRRRRDEQSRPWAPHTVSKG